MQRFKNGADDADADVDAHGAAGNPAARQAVFAVKVLDGIDFELAAGGVLLRGAPDVLIAWPEISAALGPHQPATTIARLRITQLLRLRRRVADLGARSGELILHGARPMALPTDHALHLGAGWVQERLRGGALDLGIGVRGVLNDRAASEVMVLPPSVAAAAQFDPTQAWPQLSAHAETMGGLAAARFLRDGVDHQVLRPVGGCDVLTLLSSAALRRTLAQADGTGLRAVAVAHRERGWLDVRRIDPAFLCAMWALTLEQDRGVAQALLITKDEVTRAAEGGDVVRFALDHGTHNGTDNGTGARGEINPR